MPHLVEAMCLSFAATNVNAECPSGNALTTRVRLLISRTIRSSGLFPRSWRQRVEFVRDNVPGANRLFIAIVPAAHRNGDAAIDLEKLRNLQRYEVYTIHTGNAKSDDHPGQPIDIPVRWLTQLAELRRPLDDALTPKCSKILQSATCQNVCDWLKRASGTRIV